LIALLSHVVFVLFELILCCTLLFGLLTAKL